jgi:predicted dehydrogenase
VPDHDQIACMLDHFSRAVRDGLPVRPDPHEAVKSLRVLDALAKSARDGKEVVVG